MKCTILIENEVDCFISGLNPTHLSHFWESYGVPAENYFFNPKFKLGQWDGKIRYFHTTGKTYVNLLVEIIPTLISLGYEIDTIDNRIGKYTAPDRVDNTYLSYATFDDSDSPVVLYNHQVKVINALIDNGGGTAIAATGAGKTLICAAIAKRYGEHGLRTLVIVPSQDLITQTRDDFLWLQLDTGEYSGDCKEYDTNMCVVSTWQALQKNPNVVKGFDVIVVDECHGLKGLVLQKLLNEHGANIPHRFGVTGTLPKGDTDAMAVKLAVGHVQVVVTAKELMDAGVLAKLDIHIEQLVEDLTAKYATFKSEYPVESKNVTYAQFKDGYYPDYTTEKTHLQNKAARMTAISDKVMALREEGNVFILVDGVAFGKKLSKSIPDSTFVHGADKKKARKNIYDLFKNNDGLVVIATVNIASTGLNIKRIYNLVLIDIGKSFTRVIQSIGRGLRIAKDKDHVDVWDICSDLKYGKKHVAQRVKYYREAQYNHKKQKIEYELGDIL